MNSLKKQAIECGKAGNKKKAMMYLRKSKMIEKEYAKLDGQLLMIDQQLNMIQSSAFDKNVFQAMKVGKNLVDQNKVNVDEMQDLQDDLKEQMED